MYKMTSVVRSLGTTKESLTRFNKAETPCYFDNISRLFPFTVSNGVLDITYEGNNFKSIMVDSTGNSPNNDSTTAIRITGGPRLVTSIGSNFKDYIRAWRNVTIDAGSPILVEIPAHMIRVQEAERVNVDAGTSAYEISTQLPVNDYYVSGNDLNSYYATYIFKTPLTISIIESGVKTYITFRTMFDQED